MNLHAVFDTNLLISGILWRGTPFQLLKWAEEGRLRIYTSLEILAACVLMQMTKNFFLVPWLQM